MLNIQIPTIIDVSEHWETISRHARASCLDGKSSIIHDRAERRSRLWRDALVGHSGELALSLYMFGHPHAYVKSRLEREKNPWAGDGGTDLPGTRLDVKTSYLGPGKSPSGYALFVRPREFHQETVYVLGTMTVLRSPFKAYVGLVGWMPGKEYHQFKQSYTYHGEKIQGVPIQQLYPMMPLRWDGVTYLDAYPATHQHGGIEDEAV